MTKLSSSSVFQAFKKTAERWPQRDVFQVLPGTAAAYGIAPVTLSYAQVLEQVEVVSQKFEKAGYERGMRVALLLENRPVFFILWLALNKLGVSVVPINPDLRSVELEYLIADCEPCLIIALQSRQKELDAAARNKGIDLHVIGPDDLVPAPRVDAKVAEVLQDKAQEAALLYTSGTTGNPKGCVLSNTYFLLAGHWYANVGGIARLGLEGERMITPLPVFHMNAMAYSFMAMVEVGGCLIVLDRFHPRTWWSDVVLSKASCLHYLGVMPSMLMGLDVSENERRHNIRFGFGAGVDPKLQAAFEERFGFALVEAWAMTETGAGAVIAASTHDRLVGKACLGKPASDIMCRIVDLEGKDTDVDQPGELLVRRAGDDPAYGFFSHYYKNPEATAQAWDGGWFHTGDIVRQNIRGEMFFVDRKKNVIRRSGENISAVEVESVLMRHPQINAAGVTSAPDSLRGDEVFACIIAQNPTPQMAIEITHWCLERMAYYKAPGYIAFVDALPLTSTQKIQRAELKKRAACLINDSKTIKTAHLKKRQGA